MTGPVVVTKQFHQPVEVLWQAITQLQHMRIWFFENIPDFKPENGFKTSFMVDAGERKFLHLWKLLEVVPGEKIVYDWRYEGYTGVAQVTFGITPAGDKTQLTVTHEIIEEFPQHIPEFSRESCRKGWEYFIHESLFKYLQRYKAN